MLTGTSETLEVLLYYLDNMLQLSIGQWMGVVGTVIRLGDLNLKNLGK